MGWMGDRFSSTKNIYLYDFFHLKFLFGLASFGVLWGPLKDKRLLKQQLLWSVSSPQISDYKVYISKLRL